MTKAEENRIRERVRLDIKHRAWLFYGALSAFTLIYATVAAVGVGIYLSNQQTAKINTLAYKLCRDSQRHGSPERAQQDVFRGSAIGLRARARLDPPVIAAMDRSRARDYARAAATVVPSVCPRHLIH